MKGQAIIHHDILTKEATLHKNYYEKAGISHSFWNENSHWIWISLVLETKNADMKISFPFWILYWRSEDVDNQEGNGAGEEEEKKIQTRHSGIDLLWSISI